MKTKLPRSESLPALRDKLSAPNVGRALQISTGCERYYCAHIWKIELTIVVFSIFHPLTSNVNLAYPECVMLLQVSLLLFTKVLLL